MTPNGYTNNPSPGQEIGGYSGPVARGNWGNDFHQTQQATLTATCSGAGGQVSTSVTITLGP